MICECLDLRKKYVYNEEVAPWRKVAAEKSDTLKKKSDPFHFEPVEATAVSYYLINDVQSSVLFSIMVESCHKITMKGMCI